MRGPRARTPAPRPGHAARTGCRRTSTASTRPAVRNSQPIRFAGRRDTRTKPTTGTAGSPPARTRCRRSSPSCSRAADPGPRTPAQPPGHQRDRPRCNTASHPPGCQDLHRPPPPTIPATAGRRYRRPGQRPCRSGRSSPGLDHRPPAPGAATRIITCSVARPATMGKEAACTGPLVPASRPPGTPSWSGRPARA